MSVRTRVLYFYSQEAPLIIFRKKIFRVSSLIGLPSKNSEECLGLFGKGTIKNGIVAEVKRNGDTDGIVVELMESLAILRDCFAGGGYEEISREELDKEITSETSQK